MAEVGGGGSAAREPKTAGEEAVVTASDDDAGGRRPATGRLGAGGTGGAEARSRWALAVWPDDSSRAALAWIWATVARAAVRAAAAALSAAAALARAGE